MRAMKSLKRYPLPVTTEKEACALEGVGSFTARRMMRGLPAASAPSKDGSGGNNSRRTDEENIHPCHSSSSSSSRGASRKTNTDSGHACGSSSSSSGAGCRPSNNNGTSGALLRMNLRVDSSSSSSTITSTSRSMGSGGTVSLSSNFAALRGDVSEDGGGAQTPDVTPKRPTSRARREEVGGGAAAAGRQVLSSKAPSFFSGHWEAWLLVDNRENDFMSMQVGCAGGVRRRGRGCSTFFG